MFTALAPNYVFKPTALQTLRFNQNAAARRRLNPALGRTDAVMHAPRFRIYSEGPQVSRELSAETCARLLEG